MRGRIVIAGIGHTAYGKQPGRSTVSLNLEACRKAIEDAGVGPGEVDSLLVGPPRRSRYVRGQRRSIRAVGPRLGPGKAHPLNTTQKWRSRPDSATSPVTLADNPRTGTRQATRRPGGMLSSDGSA